MDTQPNKMKLMAPSGEPIFLHPIIDLVTIVQLGDDSFTSVTVRGVTHLVKETIPEVYRAAANYAVAPTTAQIAEAAARYNMTLAKQDNWIISLCFAFDTSVQEIVDLREGKLYERMSIAHMRLIKKYQAEGRKIPTQFLPPPKPARAALQKAERTPEMLKGDCCGGT